jgi:hypothetical protein
MKESSESSENRSCAITYIQTAVAYLTTQVKDLSEQDCFKLCNLLGFLKAVKDETLTLKFVNQNEILWYVYAAQAVHNSHTGAIMTLGKGTLQSISAKQKINSRSSTEAE